MKAVIAMRSGSPRVVELPEPPVGEGTVRVRVSHSALSLPEEFEFLRTIAGRLKPGEDGLPMGCMCSGILEEVGPGVRNLKEGLRVAAYGAPYVYHAGRLSVPATLVVELPKKVNHEEGAFAGVGAVAMNLFRAAEVTLGESLLVFGAGMTGILLAQIARAAGVSPVITDAHENRLAKARNVGIPHTPRDEVAGLVTEVTEVSGGLGADAAVLTLDAPADAFERATQLLRPGGRVVVCSRQWERCSTELLLEKELVLRAVVSAGPGRHDPTYERLGVRYPVSLVRWTVRDNMQVFLNLLADRRVQITPLITERLPLERAEVAYDKIARSQNGIIGAVFSV
jgi:threonine dehydrogenase-like Zn-dependent dehydrogenase